MSNPGAPVGSEAEGIQTETSADISKVLSKKSTRGCCMQLLPHILVGYYPANGFFVSQRLSVAWFSFTLDGCTGSMKMVFMTVIVAVLGCDILSIWCL